MKHAYTVYFHDYGNPVADDNMIICDQSNLVFAVNKLLDKTGSGHKSVSIKRCELVIDDKDSDKYRMGAWGKTSGE
jgi:hypothetical protein